MTKFSYWRLNNLTSRTYAHQCWFSNLKTENNAIINMGLRYMIYIDFNFSVYVIISGIARSISNLTYESRFLKEKYAK